MVGALFANQSTPSPNDYSLKYYNLACAKVIEEFESPTMETIQVLVLIICFSLRKIQNNMFV